ncbi:trimeric intracellular cation channel family protein [Oscillospiraceae bacterium Marseille-Q3528]|nr:trimeric intracellular cation channel family protein [Oscillospiraceae bacterium Marseille-Q3528]WNV56988.1 trimeric intracellular cation channel family protein [Oscillospiraceae bacterium NTUH-002-81]
MENSIIFAIEIIGTIAFASSGAMLGIRKNLDIFGVVVLGLCVAVGGGIVRDIILGLTPPSAFRDPSYALTALVTAVLLFGIVYWKQEILTSRYMEIYETIMNYCDAAGLGIFTVLGVYTGYEQGYRGRFFLIFLGMLTGIGGGVIRDVLADTMPFILRKHIYAVASLAGAFVCQRLIGQNLYLALAAGTAVVLVIRILASHYRWNLPRPLHGEK